MFTLTALSKPDGGVRGIVVGDILRRFVARTIAKQIAKKVEAATAPFQCAFSTKAGCECVAHVLQSLTDLSPEVTVTSIDGVGAYDLISRNAMLLWTHAGIRLHHGKTKVWNRGGVEPEGIEELTRIARRVRPDAVFWRGDQNLPQSEQGLKVLGVPIGHPEFVKEFLEGKSREQVTMFQRIPWIEDTQAAFALLLMCGSTRANCWLRTVQPDQTEDFARRHDEEVWRCLRTILGTPSAPDEALVIATLALSAGGLGLTSAQRVKGAAHFASWADCLRMVRDRHSFIAELMIRHLEEGTAPCFQAVRQCKDSVTAAGLWWRLGQSCPSHLLKMSRTPNPTNRGTVGSRKPADSWRKDSPPLLCSLA